MHAFIMWTLHAKLSFERKKNSFTSSFHQKHNYEVSIYEFDISVKERIWRHFWTILNIAFITQYYRLTAL